MDGIEAEDGKEAPLRWAHIDIAGTMEVRNMFVNMRYSGNDCVVGNKAYTVLGEGNDGPSCSVS